MIVSFTRKEVEEFYRTGKSKTIPPTIQKRALVKLDRLNITIEVNELRVPPGNRLELLKGDLDGFYSIRINDQFRIIFRFEDGDASDVDIVDYH